ncbi:MAG: hypothetical protein KDA21_01130 [Phycisphaerales bacterium]|nr:hypothetical protein [Phycisphaerales bacterium]
METHRHLELKRIAAAWLLSRGCLAVAPEVTAPIPRFRLDVAGYGEGRRLPDESGRRPPPQPRTVAIECKQVRSDFIRDSRARERLLKEREMLEQRCAFLEETHVRHHEPHLRESGSSLFTEMEAWDFAGSRLASYRETMERLTRVEQALYKETKFCTMARYRLADELFVMAPPGVLTRRELPRGWGLVLCPEALLRGRPRPIEDLIAMFTEAAPEEDVPGFASSPVKFRRRLIRNIAIAATREAYRGQMAPPGTVQLSLPGFGPAAGPQRVESGTHGSST